MSTPIEQVEAQLNQIILGKPAQVRLCLACLLADGHLLIEDAPGMGKTTLAHALANTLGLAFQRIQFTSDLLPSDVVGVSIFKREAGVFEFQKGPVFSQLLLADEINRASPKTQSALLEAMEERQVSMDGNTYPLPKPFFVIATQNPAQQIGTFPLPESQLDRFLMRISLGYPSPAAERQLLQNGDRRLLAVARCLSPEQLADLQTAVKKIHVADPILDYVQALIQYSRTMPHFNAGLSPRAGLGLLQAARAHALLCRRGMVIPEDIQAVLPSVAIHRVLPSQQHTAGDSVMQTWIKAVPVN